MLLIALVYLLLAVDITVMAGASVYGMRGSFFIEAGTFGVFFRKDREIDLSAAKKRRAGGGGKRASPAGKRRLRKALRLLRAGRFKSVDVHMRLGLSDAAGTAVAAGSLRAALLAALSGLRVPARVAIEPDFGSPCCLLAARGISSFRLGDIILAALKTARRNRKEGLKWTSIPLRA